MTKDQRAQLLRSRYRAVAGSKAWRPPAGGAKPKEPETKRRGGGIDAWFGFVAYYQESPRWLTQELKTPDEPPPLTVQVARRGHVHPLTVIAAKFESARRNSENFWKPV